MRERVAALAHLPATVMPENEPAALSLLEPTLTLERDLLVQIAGATAVNDLKDLDWSAAGTKVYLPQWNRITEANAAVFSGITAAQLPAVLRKPGSFRQHFQKQTEQTLSDEQLLRALAGAAGCALAATLAQQGFALSCELGMPVFFRRDNLQLEPFTIVSNLQRGNLTPEEWQKQCLEAGIADVNLSAVSA